MVAASLLGRGPGAGCERRRRFFSISCFHDLIIQLLVVDIFLDEMRHEQCFKDFGNVAAPGVSLTLLFFLLALNACIFLY